MSQQDFNITTADANTGVSMRAAINAALQALASLSSGASAPATTYPFQLWADTTNDLLKMRNEANNDWIELMSMSDARPSYIPSSVSSTELGYLDGVTSLIQSQLNAKQATLVSGTNIKTVGGTSLLGQGDVPVSAFPFGTLMLFQQTNAPTGWIKQTTHDNKALRVVSGTAGSGGSVNFTAAFAGYTPSGSVSIAGGGISASSLTVAQLASHNHTTPRGLSGIGDGYKFDYVFGSNSLSSTSTTSGYTGSNSTHTHGYSSPSGSFTGTARSFEVQYVDLIIAYKD